MGDIVYREFAGVRNDLSPERFNPGDLVMADNCDLDATGKLQRRQGYTQKLAGDVHSLWSDGETCLFVSGDTLSRLAVDYTNETLRSGLTPGARMAYCKVNARIYYSNGYQTGVIEDGASRSWGLPPPLYQPLASVISGELFSGTYQFALTYLRRDGQESGTSLAESIEVPAGGGISFTAIAVAADPDITQKILYLSTANGEILYRALILDNATTSASYIESGIRLQSPLDTQFLQGAFPGQTLAYYRGRIYIAIGNLLFPSEPHGYELFDVRKFLPFAKRVTLLAPVEDGLFVGTQNETVFLAGRGPEDFDVTMKAPYGAIAGTLAYAPASLVKQAQNQGEARVAFWLSPQGICLGMNQGAVLNLTQQYSFNPSAAGAGLFRRGESAQYLACL